MKEEALHPVVCPFCGAPQRKFIPTNSFQVKCQYCSGIILLPRLAGHEEQIPRCPNHPDTTSAGICSDCGSSFCLDCLSPWQFPKSRWQTEFLYLCPSCLKRRHGRESQELISIGAIGLFFGLLTTIVFLWAGLIVVFLSVCSIAYGMQRKRAGPRVSKPVYTYD